MYAAKKQQDAADAEAAAQKWEIKNNHEKWSQIEKKFLSSW
jgi:hypothetical protein